MPDYNIGLWCNLNCWLIKGWIVSKSLFTFYSSCKEERQNKRAESRGRDHRCSIEESSGTAQNNGSGQEQGDLHERCRDSFQSLGTEIQTRDQKTGQHSI